MTDSGPRTTAPGALAAIRREYWVVVGLLNAAFLALALGVLVLLFRHRPSTGVGLLGVGVVALGLGVRRYRRVRMGKG